MYGKIRTKRSKCSPVTQSICTETNTFPPEQTSGNSIHCDSFTDWGNWATGSSSRKGNVHRHLWKNSA